MTIADAPGLPPWVKGFASVGNRGVLLADNGLFTPCCEAMQPRFRYEVGADEWEHIDRPCECNRGLPGRLLLVLRTDDYAEALAVFERERDALASGEA